MHPFLPNQENRDEGSPLWLNEEIDSKVEYLESRIKAGHHFNKKEWPGGEAYLPILKPRQPKPKCLPNKPIVRRKQPKRSTTKVNLQQPSIQKPVSRKTKEKPLSFDAAALDEAIQNN